MLEPRRDAFLRIGRQASVEMWIGWSQGGSQGGFELDPSIVRLIADLGGSIVLDIYRD
jgi:hypothetical protein